MTLLHLGPTKTKNEHKKRQLQRKYNITLQRLKVLKDITKHIGKLNILILLIPSPTNNGMV